MTALIALLVGSLVGAEPAPPAEADLAAAADYSQAYRGQTCLVLFDGRTVLERYSGGGAAERRQMLASGSKSFVGIAAVAAVEDGLIDLDEPVAKVLTEWAADPERARITHRQLLTLTSGLTASERGSPTRAPAWAEIAARPIVARPGASFAYGAYPLNTFAYALQRRLGDETFEAYLKRRIFDPLGVTVEWKFRCADGHPQVGGGAFMTARDWARFGEFVRLDGQVDGRAILPPGRVAGCFTGTEANPAYGLTWWLKKPVGDALRRQSLIVSEEWAEAANCPWLPDDLVAACGAGKQRLYVIPSRKLVVVRQGGLGRGFSDVEFLSKLLGHGPGTP